MSDRASLQALGAPDWAVEVVSQMTQTRDEMRESAAHISRAMNEFAEGVGMMTANDEMILGELRGLRDEVRSRLSNHDRELNDVRARMDKLEDRVNKLVPGPDLREELATIKAELAELRALVQSDGK
jgi:chromosome segregation ATPase